MEQSLTRRIENTGLIQRGDCILVGLSGGPDSVCLLHALVSMRRKWELTLYAAHLNHNLRGMDANQDAGFAMALSKDLDVHCLVKSVDVEKIAREQKLSIEAAGRLCRYDFLYEVAEKTGASKIAVAHHLNDQAETVIMHLLRGSGMAGLGGMKAQRGKIVRPLLDIKRETILSYCDTHQLTYCRDITNDIPDATRNRIRLELIPQLESYNPEILRSLGGTAQLMQQDEAALDQMAKEVFSKGRDEGDAYSFSRPELVKQPDAIVARVIRKAWQCLNQTDHTLQRNHVASILKAMQQSDGDKCFHLPGGVHVRVTPRMIMCQHRQDVKDHHKPMAAVVVKRKGTTWLPEGRGWIHCEVTPALHPVRFDQNANRQIISADVIPHELQVRTRQRGESWQPLGMKGNKSIKKTLMEMRIPIEKRDDCLLLCHDQQVIWILGGPISEKVRVKEDTRNVMLLEYRP